MFLRQFLSPLVYILVAAAVIKWVVSGWFDATVILATLLIMAVIGFVQESRAEKAMEALLQLAAPRAKVRRGGQAQSIPARDIVPGDIILLEAGDRVPADARLLESSNLKVNEAPLTGESMPVDKHTDVLRGDLSVADRRNLVYMGTAVTYGRAVAMTVATGMRSEIGGIAGAIAAARPVPTPLQKSIANLGRYILIVTGITLALLAVVGYVRGLPWLEILVVAIAAAVAAIPEGLPAVVTVVLAVGMRLMARRNAIIRQLVAVETLGSATVICSDKTGTLTLNQMTVKRLWQGGRWIEVEGEGYDTRGGFRTGEAKLDAASDPDLALMLRGGALCNDALITGEDKSRSILGDPTEGALVVAAAKAGFTKEKLELAQPRFDEIPFQSERLYMATLHPEGEGRAIFVKGAPERILGLSSHYLKGGQRVALDEDGRRVVLEANATLAADAMRVIAVAWLHQPVGDEELLEDEFRGQLTLLGLAGMTDPPREEAIKAIARCRQAGIRVVMITGDNALTATAIARQLGLPEGRTVTGAELAVMDDPALEKAVADAPVFARIEPLHKLRIVTALKKQGEVVAMTGDGVNDAPALKSADIGIAMGITGTDVAKEASAMVLADDNFASVVAAVEEGRAIFDRLRNVLFFLLSTGLGSLLAIILAVGWTGASPLVAVQIIWVNLVTGTIIAIPLGLEPKLGNELARPPRHPKVGLVFPGLLFRIFLVAVLMAVPIAILFAWALANRSLAEAQTLAFCAMVVVQWLLVYTARSDEVSPFRISFLRNRWLLLSLLGALLLQLAVIYLPFLQPVFKTAPLGWDEWGMVIGASLAVFLVEAGLRALFPRLILRGKWRPGG
jgi:Ca2+-transporting ATPase